MAKKPDAPAPSNPVVVSTGTPDPTGIGSPLGLAVGTGATISANSVGPYGIVNPTGSSGPYGIVNPGASGPYGVTAGNLVSPGIFDHMRNLSSLTVGHSTSSGILRIPQTGSLLVSENDQQKLRSLETEIGRLRDDLGEQSRALKTEKTNAAEHKKREAKLTKTVEELEKKRKLAFLLDRVAPEVAHGLLNGDKLAAEFLKSEPRTLFAMSVDIRRSTELMLKARSPQLFAEFITDLCNGLMEIVMRHHGVVDKFTGDGILCFFPEFFSGPDAGYFALAAADACHAAFGSHYRARRNSFQSVLRDVGLGIGIDYGSCHLVQVAGGLTIVGSPVVYACRLGGAPAGTTLLNQPAYERISEKHGGVVLVNETSIEIKHEGPLVAYSAAMSRTASYKPQEPAWMALLGPDQQASKEGDA
jgi:class 3 adenylate cyclase